MSSNSGNTYIDKDGNLVARVGLIDTPFGGFTTVGDYYIDDNNELRPLSDLEEQEPITKSEAPKANKRKRV